MRVYTDVKDQQMKVEILISDLDRLLLLMANIVTKQLYRNLAVDLKITKEQARGNRGLGGIEDGGY